MKGDYQMKNLNLFMARDAVSDIVGGQDWKAPRTVADLTVSLRTLNKKCLWWERRVVVDHSIQVWEEFNYESCGGQVELRGGGQLNLLKVTLLKGTKQVTVGEKTAFWRNV